MTTTPAPPYGPPPGVYGPRPQKFRLPNQPTPSPWARRLPLLVVGLLATAALIVSVIALTKPTTTAPTPVAAEPSYTQAEIDAAKQKICDTYSKTTVSVNTTSNAPDGAEPVAVSADARSAMVSAALSLTRATNDPAAPRDIQAMANELADSYLTYVTSAYSGQYHPDKQAIINSRDQMAGACG